MYKKLGVKMTLYSKKLILIIIILNVFFINPIKAYSIEKITACHNFYEFSCGVATKKSEDKEYIIFTEKFNKHIEKIKKSFLLTEILTSKITNFKQDCYKQNIAEKICDRAAEAKFLIPYFVKNKKKIIANGNKVKINANKLFFNLKSVAIAKIKKSSLIDNENKKNIENALANSKLVFMEPKLLSKKNIDQLSTQQLAKEMFFLYGSPYLSSTNNDIILPMNSLFLFTKNEEYANQFIFLQILSHEIGHIIVNNLNGLPLYNIAVSLQNDFKDPSKRSWKLDISQTDLEEYSNYTNNENICDLLGIQLSMQYFVENKISDYKMFFSSFAKSMCVSKLKENRPFFILLNNKKTVNMDLHAKPIDRVNINVKKIQKFTDTFNCKIEDPLYFKDESQFYFW